MLIFVLNRALQKETSDKTWLCAGRMFLKVEKSKAITSLNKGRSNSCGNI